MKACVEGTRERRLAGFGLREDGSLTIFSLFLFILILMIAGTAVDLVRHERGRVAMQNTLDTAVLAASGVSQNVNPEDVVKDYVAKAGFDPDEVQITSTTNYTGASVTSRTVTASSMVTVDTMFMDLVGISELNSTSFTGAEERNTKIEIALVLDISDSMNSSSSDPSKTKIRALQDAAKEFVRVIFDTNDANDISISIVPYNHQVTVPDGILSRLTTNAGTVTVSSPPPYSGALTSYELVNPNSRCAVFDSVDYDTRELTSTGSVEISARFLQDRFWWGQNGLVQQAYQTPYEWAMWCSNLQPRIMAYSNDEAALLNYIEAMTADGATAINIGMKWGTALLDPNFKPIVEDMVTNGELAPEMNIYPTGYGNPDSQKYVVLMTDGINTNQYDLDTPYKSGPTRVWYAASETSGGTVTYDVTTTTTVNGVTTTTTTPTTRAETNYDGYYVLMPNKPANERWYKPGLPTTTADDEYYAEGALPADAVQLDYHEIYERFGVRSAARFFFQYSDSAAYSDHFYNQIQSGFSNANTNSRTICSRAKQGGFITVYTVAFEASTSGEALLQECATAPGYYFDVDGTQISDAFSAIANQIALLRLTE